MSSRTRTILPFLVWLAIAGCVQPDRGDTSTGDETTGEARSQVSQQVISDECPVIEEVIAGTAWNIPTDCHYCGDRTCGPGEQETCPSDCEFCGNGRCGSSESTATCPRDCGTRCGDLVCNGSENISTCLFDCGPKLRSVVVERVRHCRNDAPWPCNSRVSHPEYGWWDHFNVDLEKQKRTYLSRALNPPRAVVQHLVFIATGQQGGGDDDAQPSMMTGQNDSWKAPFSRSEMDEVISLRDGSLARALVEQQVRSSSNTFMGLAFDARFNNGFSPSNKQEIENAYYEWLKEKFDAGNLRSIYLAGHSRGGCLVFRLARRFKQDFPDVPLIVHGFDPVCNHGDGELGTWDGRVDNPLVADWEYFTRPTDIPGQFPVRNKLAVLNMVSGEQVLVELIDWTIRVRAFGFDRAFSPAEQTFNFEDWYEQAWFTTTHLGMGNNSAPIGRAISHLQASCARLGC
jgi:hypothetical protein